MLRMQQQQPQQEQQQQKQNEEKASNTPATHVSTPKKHDYSKFLLPSSL